jgi:predicted glycoside hydrolase/deacetylase ChbG (UPF0249 family)
LVFVEAFNESPSHVDGHQHIHIIPEIAEILSTIMTESFGIYQTRIPIENISILEERIFNPKSLEFYKEVIEQSKISMEFFKFKNITYSTNFIGMSLMGKNLTETNFSENLTFLKDNSDPIELMCHPVIIY